MFSDDLPVISTPVPRFPRTTAPARTLPVEKVFCESASIWMPTRLLAVTRLEPARRTWDAPDRRTPAWELEEIRLSVSVTAGAPATEDRAPIRIPSP